MQKLVHETDDRFSELDELKADTETLAGNL